MGQKWSGIGPAKAYKNPSYWSACDRHSPEVHSLGWQRRRTGCGAAPPRRPAGVDLVENPRRTPAACGGGAAAAACGGF